LSDCSSYECGHGSFSTKSWLNTVVGHFCMAPLANSFYTWQLTHDHHHLYTQLRGQEVDWAANLVTKEEFDSLTWQRAFLTRLGYTLPFGIFLWIGWNTIRRGLMLERLLSEQQLAHEKRKIVRSNVITGIFLIVIYGGLWYFFGFWEMIKYYGIPATVAMVTGWFIITIQHATDQSLLYEKTDWTPVRGQLVSTFNIRFPRWLEYLWCNINIHIPHHVCPVIPWYYLKQAGNCIRQDFPDCYQEQHFRFHLVSCFYRAPFLRKVEEKGYYILEMNR